MAVTNFARLALSYAAQATTPVLYEVAPIRYLTLDPDFPPFGDRHVVACCPAARIVRRYEPAPEVLAGIADELRAGTPVPFPGNASSPWAVTPRFPPPDPVCLEPCEPPERLCGQ